ncbi:MAG TPA: hypothetical protein VG448_03295 [Solirubrobacterales bacterium]|nr:hypothetical protein [Solirubrobacterales bacterium]
MKVALGEFACFCVASRFGADLGFGIEAAARYYSRKLGSQAGSGPRSRLPKRLESPFVELDVPIDAEVVARLEQEALTRAVDVQQLLNHAVFVYFAELDRSG